MHIMQSQGYLTRDGDSFSFVKASLNYVLFQVAVRNEFRRDIPIVMVFEPALELHKAPPILLFV